MSLQAPFQPERLLTAFDRAGKSLSFVADFAVAGQIPRVEVSAGTAFHSRPKFVDLGVEWNYQNTICNHPWTQRRTAWGVQGGSRWQQAAYPAGGNPFKSSRPKGVDG
jgi:hypothetical protein